MGDSSGSGENTAVENTAVENTALFYGIDRALFVSTFVDRLRRIGLAVPLGSAERAAAALEAVGPIGLQDLYWIFKLTLTQRQDDFELFDRMFSAVFDFELNRTVRQTPHENLELVPLSAHPDDALQSLRVPDKPGESEAAGAVPWITRPQLRSEDDETDPDDDDTVLPELLPSTEGQGSETPFDLLDEAELARLGAALEDTIHRLPTRRSRRTAGGSRGTPSMRRTLRSAMKTGGEPFRIHRERPRRRPRRVLFLVDVSGSMESFVRPYLHITRALAVSGRAEVFAFATSLTRLTPALRCRSAAEAMDRATLEVDDRFAGTRLASSLGELMRHRVWGGLVRGAVVVIISDGWDTEPPAEMTARMSRLRRLAHRVIWVNPRSAAPEFEPLVGSMAAALPFCDQFLSGHSRRALDDVLAALASSD